MGIRSHPRCDQVVEIASDYLEHALPLEATEQLEQHLIICADCERYVRQLQSVVGMAHDAPRLDADDVAPEALAQLLGAFRAWKGGSAP